MRALRLGSTKRRRREGTLKAALAIDVPALGGVARPGVINYKEARTTKRSSRSARRSTSSRATCDAAARRRAIAARVQEGCTRQSSRASERGDDPNRRDAAARLASLLRDSGDYEDAWPCCAHSPRLKARARRSTPSSPHLTYCRSATTRAARAREGVELDSGDKKDPAIYNALALLSLKQGRAQEAFERFDHAASLDANYIDARFNKASVLLDAGDYARAKVELAAIVEKRPDDFAAQVALGVAHRGLKEHKEAARVWGRVIKEAPRRGQPSGERCSSRVLKADFLKRCRGCQGGPDQYLQESRRATRSGRSRKRNERTSGNELGVTSPRWGHAAALVALTWR